MNLKVLLLVPALALAGCASFGNFTGINPTVSPQAADVAVNTFDALEAAATAYNQLPLCAAGASIACHTAGAKAAIKPAILTGRTARNELEAALKASGGAAIPVLSWNNLQSAITTLQSLYANYNIQAAAK